MDYVTPLIWMPVLDHAGLYDASSHGDIRSLPRLDLAGRPIRGRIMKQQQDEHGRMSVGLHKDGKQKTHRVHRLVAEAFLGPCPPGLEVAHWDDIPWHNEITNLRFATSHENKMDMVRNGRHYEANQTTCPQGHEYTPENTFLGSKGERNCRICHNEFSRLRRLDQITSGPRCINGCDVGAIAFGLCVRCYTRERTAETRDEEWYNLVCPWCNKPFVRQPEIGQGKRKYCSDICSREASLHKMRENMRRKRAAARKNQ